MKNRNHALILAGGSGHRAGYDIPKQMIPINDIPLIIHTLRKFENCNEIDTITVVSHNSYVEDIYKLCLKHDISKIIKCVMGGSTRQESSYFGVKALDARSDDVVIIHDAARPYLNESIIKSAINEAREHHAASAVISVTDTVYITQNGSIVSVPDRKTVYNAQTPQSFIYQTIVEAHQKALDDKISDATDDIILALNTGIEPVLFEGDVTNKKITTKEDLEEAQRLLF